MRKLQKRDGHQRGPSGQTSALPPLQIGGANLSASTHPNRKSPLRLRRLRPVPFPAGCKIRMPSRRKKRTSSPARSIRKTPSSSIPGVRRVRCRPKPPRRNWNPKTIPFKTKPGPKIPRKLKNSPAMPTRKIPKQSNLGGVSADLLYSLCDLLDGVHRLSPHELAHPYSGSIGISRGWLLGREKQRG